MQKIEVNITMPPEVAANIKMETGLHCPRCGGELWLYQGAPKREWDMDDHEHIDLRPGQTMPCKTCHDRLHLLYSEIEKMRYMRKAADAEPPAIKGKQVAPTDEWRARKERAQKVLDQQQAHICEQAAAWGFDVRDVYDRMGARAHRREVAMQ